MYVPLTMHLDPQMAHMSQLRWKVKDYDVRSKFYTLSEMGDLEQELRKLAKNQTYWIADLYALRLFDLCSVSCALTRFYEGESTGLVPLSEMQIANYTPMTSLNWDTNLTSLGQEIIDYPNITFSDYVYCFGFCYECRHNR